jgi:hypothetical protein
MKRALRDTEFSNIPEGEQIIRIKEVDESGYEEFGKLVVTVEDKDGNTARVNFNFIKDDGSPNDIADGIYARMCRAVLNDPNADEPDSQDLVGGFALVEVAHATGSKGGTFANIKKWLGSASGFDTKRKGAPAQTAPVAEPRKKSAAEIIAEMKAKSGK